MKNLVLSNEQMDFMKENEKVLLVNLIGSIYSEELIAEEDQDKMKTENLHKK